MQQIYVVVSLAETQQRRFLLFVTRLCFHDDVSVQHYHQCHFIFYHQRCRMVPRLFMVLFIIINLILIIIVVIIKCICIAQEHKRLQMCWVNSYLWNRNVSRVFLNMAIVMSGAEFTVPEADYSTPRVPGR